MTCRSSRACGGKRTDQNRSRFFTGPGTEGARRYGTRVRDERHTHHVTTRTERREQPGLWPPLLTVLGGLVVGYVSFIAAAGVCLAESITAFGTTGCTGPLWTTVGLLVASGAVLFGGVLVVTRIVIRARATREDGS